MKRITKIYEPHEVHVDTQYSAVYTPDNTNDTFTKTGYLAPKLNLDVPTWRKMGQPKKLRVTISMVE